MYLAQRYNWSLGKLKGRSKTKHEPGLPRQAEVGTRKQKRRQGSRQENVKFHEE